MTIGLNVRDVTASGAKFDVTPSNTDEVYFADVFVYDEYTAYDEGKEREGYQDVANIKEDIVQRLCTKPYFGGAFTVLKPIAWAMQQDDTYPYYFGACSLTCTAPAMTQDTEMEELV